MVKAWRGCSPMRLLPQYSKSTFLGQEWLKRADDFDKYGIWSSVRQSFSEAYAMKLLPEPPPFPVVSSSRGGSGGHSFQRSVDFHVSSMENLDSCFPLEGTAYLVKGARKTHP